MDPIPIHLLNSFLVFAQSNNITDAADRLQITQPALSKQLKSLEALLPQPLFTLSGRKKILTPFGQDLHLRLQERLGNIQQVVRQTWSLHAHAANTVVRIAGRRGVLDRFSGKLGFQGSIFFQELSNEETVESVLNQNCEIGIVHSFPENFELVAKPLFKEEFQFVIPKKFVTKRPAFGQLLFSQLKTFPCLGYRPADEIIQAACSLDPFEIKSLKMVRATENYLSIAEMVDDGVGWSVLPSYLKVSESRNWVIPVPGRILPTRQFFIIFRKEFSSVPWFKTLTNEIKRCFERE